MAKHFGLKSFVPQNNNYVVFDEYFRTPVSSATSGAPSTSIMNNKLDLISD